MKIWAKISITYFVIVICLAVTIFTTLRTFEVLFDNTGEMVEEAIPLRTATSDLLTNLVNQDTGVRGYIITEDESYLEPYHQGLEDLKRNLELIESLYGNHPTMIDLIQNKAKPQIDILAFFYGEQIKLVQGGNAVRAMNNINNGKHALDNFRAVHQEILLDNEKLMNDAWNESQQSGLVAVIFLIAGGVVAIAVSISSAIYLNRSVVKPINHVKKQIDEIAEGEGDLTKELQIKSKDELADLSNSFNAMLRQLRNLISDVSQTTDQVAASSEQLMASANQTSLSTEQIVMIVEEVSAGSDKQLKSVSSASTVVQEISNGADQVAATAEEVVSSSRAASDSVRTGNEAIQSAVQQMSSINSTVSSLSHSIKGLGDKSIEIGTIVKVITTIAEQTNLLALNAAIEAARAGEHGKGFAVVADEVRKLAEESSNSAKQISSLIYAIQNETEQVVSSMEVATSEVSDGINIISSAGTSFEQIQEVVQQVVDQIGQVAHSAKGMVEGTAEMVDSIDEITAVSNQTSAGTNNVSAATEEQLASMEEITASAVALSEMSADLQKIVGKFKF